MSAANVLLHPTFGNPPVRNLKRRGPKKGTVSLNVVRMRRAREAALREIEQRKSPTRRMGRFMTELLSLGLSESDLRRLYDALRKDEPAGRDDD